VPIDDAALFDACFRGHAAHVYAFALRRTDAQTAQDVTAETFLIAWRRRAVMPAEPLAWLYGIARKVLANEMRAAHRRGALASRVARSTRQSAPAATGEHQVLEALAGLHERDREALLLCAWEGLSVKDAAAVVGYRAATFAVRLHRARGRLSRVLDEMAGSADAVRCHDAVSEAAR
jgi:RNA polymerase sigma-70 factor (ECF subfamily)